MADEDITLTQIAAVIGRRLNVPVASKTPEEAMKHFGWFANFVGADIPGSSKWTREHLGWQPKQPGLISDIDRPSYFETNEKTFDQKVRSSTAWRCAICSSKRFEVPVC